jgi:flagellar M-ring protein FliF
VGFKKERGDSVRVVNIAFRPEPKVEPEITPIYRDPWVLDLLRAGAVPAALTLVALMLLFGVVRPALKVEKVVPPLQLEAPKTLNAVVDDDDDQAVPDAESQALLAIEGNKLDRHLSRARAMAIDDPQAVASILRGWVNGAEA